MLLLPAKTVTEARLVEDALDVVLLVKASWTVDKVKSKLFTDGITNKLVGFWTIDDSSKKDMLLVRVYGQVSWSGKQSIPKYFTPSFVNIELKDKQTEIGQSHFETMHFW